MGKGVCALNSKVMVCPLNSKVMFCKIVKNGTTLCRDHTGGNMLLGLPSAGQEVHGLPGAIMMETCYWAYLLLVKRCMDYQGHTDGNMLLGLPSAGQEVHGLPGAY